MNKKEVCDKNITHLFIFYKKTLIIYYNNENNNNT